MSKDDLNPRGQIIIPASWRIVGPDAQTPGSVGVIATAADRINSFVFAQRQRVNTSSIDIHKATFSSPDIDITYHNQFGSERIELTPYVRRPTIEHQAEETPDVPVPETTSIQLHEDQPVLCLLVLYKTNQIAVFDMASLSASEQGAGATLIQSGTLHGTDFGTDNILVNQLNGVILGGADLTGKSDGSMLCLCTTLISDTVVTSTGLTSSLPAPGDGSSTTTASTLPLMNVANTATPRTAYTIAGAYTIASTGISLATSALANLAPIAIAADGTSYYYGGARGPASLGIAGLSNAPDDAAAKELSDLFQRISEMEQPSTGAYYFYSSTDYTDVQNKITVQQVGQYAYIGSGVGGYNEYELTGETTQNQMDQTTFQTGGIADGPKVNVSISVGTGLFAQGPFGQEPSLTTLNIAISPGTYKVFDPALNATTFAVGSLNVSDYSSQLARSVFSPSKGLAVVVDPVTASGSVTTTVASTPGDVDPNYRQEYTFVGFTSMENINTTYPLVLIANGGPGAFGEQQPPLYLSGGMYTHATGTECGANLGGVTSDAITAFGKSDYNAEALRTLIEDLFIIAGHSTSYPYSSSSSLTSTISTIGVGVFGEPKYSGTPYTSSSSGSSDYTVSIPTFASTVITQITQGTLSWGSENVSSYARSVTGQGLAASFGALADDTVGEIQFYPFPPCLDPSLGTKATCYYEVDKGPLGHPTKTVTTPFDTYTDTLSPWLHVSNAQHYIQGYAIGTDTNQQNHLYLDGYDFMPFLAKALGCQANDVVACYMDIPLPITQGIDKITSSSTSMDASTGS